MDMIKIKKRFLLNIVALYAILGYGYYFFFYIFQNYANKIGFGLDINWLKMVEGFVVIMLMSLFYVYNDLNESVYLTFTFVFYTFIMVPSASYYFLTDQSRAYFYMQVMVMLILLGIFELNKRLFSGSKSGQYAFGMTRRSLGNKRGIAMKLFVAIVGLFMLADIIIYIKYGNSILYLFKLDKVYDIRLKARDSVPSKLKYVVSWSAMVIIPSSIAWCLKRRKYFLIALPIFLQVLIFTIGGTKSHIFTLAMVVFFYGLFTLKKMEWFIPSMNALLAVTLLIKNNYILAVVVKRAFFYPMSISYSYYDFFNQFPQMHLSQSIFKHFFTNPYKLDAPFVISRYVYKAPVMSANTNFISNAFANYGFLGIIVFTLILALLLVTMERISSGKVGKQYIILFAFCPFYALVNSALFTVMMTHGFLFALFLAFLFFKDEPLEDGNGRYS